MAAYSLDDSQLWLTSSRQWAEDYRDAMQADCKTDAVYEVFASSEVGGGQAAVLPEIP